MYGSAENSSLEQMELLSTVKGLDALTRPCYVTLFSESHILQTAFNNRWIEYWAQNGWRGSQQVPEHFVEEWKTLTMYSVLHDIGFQFVGYKKIPEEFKRCRKIAEEIANGNIRKKS